MDVRFFYTTYVSDRIEGISKNIHHLALGLRSLGIDVRLHAPEVDVADLNDKVTYLAKALSALREMRRVMASWDFDLLHCHLQLPSMGVLAHIARFMAGRPGPLVGHLWNAYLPQEESGNHGGGVDASLHRLLNSSWTARMGLGAFDALLLPSRYQLEQVRRLGFDGKLFHAPNGVDVHECRPHTPEERSAARRTLGLPEEGPVILYYGHFSPWKGAANAVKAMSAVLEAHPDATLLLSWSGYGRDPEVFRALEGLQLDGNAKLIGRSQPPLLHAAADVALLPLTSAVGTACHPNVLLECLAAGLPTVASRVGSVPELVEEGRTGFLAPPGDPEAIAAAISDLLDHPERARAMGKAARSLMEREYNWERVSSNLLGIYDQVT